MNNVVCFLYHQQNYCQYTVNIQYISQLYWFSMQASLLLGLIFIQLYINIHSSHLHGEYFTNFIIVLKLGLSIHVYILMSEKLFVCFLLKGQIMMWKQMHLSRNQNLRYYINLNI